MLCSKRVGELEWIFWSKIDWDIHNKDCCWLWMKTIHPKGYAQFRFTDIYGKRHTVYAHRMAYEFEFGEIPEVNENGDLVQIDHMCHDPKMCQLGDSCPHRRCCNPFHMKLSTIQENSSRERASSLRANREQNQESAKRGWVTRRARLNQEVR